MNASEFAFKSFYCANLSDFNDWALLTPSDWVCFISASLDRPDGSREIMDALCQKYAPALVGAKGIVFYRNPSTAMKVVVGAADDVGNGEQLGCWGNEVNGGDGKRFLNRPGEEGNPVAGVFATYDLEGNIIAIAVFLRR